MKPTVTHVLPLVHALYRRSPVGCCWHLVLDDGNFDSEIVKLCNKRAYACTEGPECRDLVGLLVQMSKTQLRVLAARKREDSTEIDDLPARRGRPMIKEEADKVEALKEAIGASLSEFVHQWELALHTVAATETDCCLKIVEACRHPGRSEDWNAGLAYAVQRLKDWKAESAKEEEG